MLASLPGETRTNMPSWFVHVFSLSVFLYWPFSIRFCKYFYFPQGLCTCWGTVTLQIYRKSWVVSFRPLQNHCWLISSGKTSFLGSSSWSVCQDTRHSLISHAVHLSELSSCYSSGPADVNLSQWPHSPPASEMPCQRCHRRQFSYSSRPTKGIFTR